MGMFSLTREQGEGIFLETKGLLSRASTRSWTSRMLPLLETARLGLTPKMEAMLETSGRRGNLSGSSEISKEANTANTHLRRETGTTVFTNVCVIGPKREPVVSSSGDMN